MGKFCNTRWIDFGDFGQYEAEVSGTTGDFGFIDSVKVTHKGETLELVRLLPRDYEQVILEEAECDERAFYADQRDEWLAADAMERSAA